MLDHHPFRLNKCFWRSVIGVGISLEGVEDEFPVFVDYPSGYNEMVAAVSQQNFHNTERVGDDSAAGSSCNTRRFRRSHLSSRPPVSVRSNTD